jgi:hypothetical protein
MEPDDLLCSRNERPPKVWRKGVRSVFCSQSAHDQNVLARRPQSKAPHALAFGWVLNENGSGRVPFLLAERAR